MVLETNELKLYAFAIWVLLKAENWKESLRISSIIITFIQTIVKISYVIKVSV